MLPSRLFPTVTLMVKSVTEGLNYTFRTAVIGSPQAQHTDDVITIEHAFHVTLKCNDYD